MHDRSAVSSQCPHVVNLTKEACEMGCSAQLRVCINTDAEGGEYVCAYCTHMIDGKLVSNII